MPFAAGKRLELVAFDRLENSRHVPVLNYLPGLTVNPMDFMKTRNFPALPLTLTAFILALALGNVLAQDSTASTTASAAQSTAATQPVPQLSYGVPEVLQLSQANVGDSTIINYIHNSGNNYGLNAAQIIYLRQQGVSDAVVNAMLNQPRTLSGQPVATTSQPASTETYSAQTSTATTQPTVTYVETVPSSSVYVVPDTQTYYYNNWLYNHSPYYGNGYPYYGYHPAYYSWPYPAVSVSFGWGGYRGGWHDGWHGGGGWHSTGGWHSGGAWHGGGGRHH